MATSMKEKFEAGQRVRSGVRDDTNNYTTTDSFVTVIEGNIGDTGHTEVDILNTGGSNWMDYQILTSNNDQVHSIPADAKMITTAFGSISDGGDASVTFAGKQWVKVQARSTVSGSSTTAEIFVRSRED